MFVCIGVPTWEGNEYDADGKTDLSKINPEKFDADQLCQVAKSWGARQILFVCKHVGGFCLWPTETTSYHIGKTPWKDGKGNMVKEVAEACRRHGLNLGVYLYPDDTRYTKGIGCSGRTDDPAKQEEWSKLYIRQWEEVLTLCGPDLVNEIWLDGGCVIDIQQTIERLAPKAVLFQGMKNDQVRWVGNEAGIASDVNWNSTSKQKPDPDGDVWAPAECDTTLYDHNWFWNPKNEAKRKSLDHLMHTYVKSVGNGSVLLLNCTPDTSGAVPQGDINRYIELGAAIEENFGQPVGKTSGALAATIVECDLGGVKKINCVDIWEDYSLGHRIRAFEIDGWRDGKWVKLNQGQAVGRRKMIFFPEQELERVRIRVTRSVGAPVIRLLQAHLVDDKLARSNGTAVSDDCPFSTSSFQNPSNDHKSLEDSDFNTHWRAKEGDKAPWVEIDLGRTRKFAAMTASDLSKRIKNFTIEYRNDKADEWKKIYHGSSMIGEKFKTDFDRVTGRYVRMNIHKWDGANPMLWSWQLFDRDEAWETVGSWKAGAETGVDLSIAVNEAARYEVRCIDGDGIPVKVQGARLLFEGREAAESLGGVGTETLTVNRTQAIGPGASSRLIIITAGIHSGKIQIRPLR
ncbi:MAG: hypothetical protein RL095_4120 [Verrucomicrobiota bacterium]